MERKGGILQNFMGHMFLQYKISFVRSQDMQDTRLSAKNIHTWQSVSSECQVVVVQVVQAAYPAQRSQTGLQNHSSDELNEIYAITFLNSISRICPLLMQHQSNSKQNGGKERQTPTKRLSALQLAISAPGLEN